MKKYLASIIIMIVMFGSAVHANTLNTLDMDVYIDKNGDATVTETWDYTSNENTEMYHSYKNIGGSEFTDLEVTDSEGNRYTFEEYWDIAGSFEDKAKKCGFHEIAGGVEICWGITEYGTRTYKVKYKITNFVVGLRDAQMTYWELVPANRESKIKEVNITIAGDVPFEDTLDVWGYGNRNGLCYVADGVIKMKSPEGGLNKNEYMTIQVKFPEGYFELRPSEDEFYSYEDEFFSYYEDMAKEDSISANNTDFENVIAFSYLAFWMFVMAGIIIGASKPAIAVPKEYKNYKKDVEYYRDVPSKDLFKMYAIASTLGLNKKDEDIFGAIFLRWIKEKKATVIKPNEEGAIKTTLAKKKNVDIQLYEEFLDEAKFKMQDEAKLYNFIYDASKDGILEKNEFDKWARRNSAKFMNRFKSVKTATLKQMQEEGYIIEEKRKKTFTKEAMEMARQILGLKKYLEDYTLINEREAIEVELFEEYLVFAQMMGIADKVLEQFKNLYPDIATLSSFDSYDNIIYARTVSYSMTKKAMDIETAKARAYSGGGGGFSSGGGGGGSFGGGGSMGSR